MKSLRPERIRSLQSLTCIILFGFGVAGFTSFAAQPNLPGDWPMFGNGPAHTGYFPGKLNGLPFVSKWGRGMGGPVISQPAVAGGRVFVSIDRVPSLPASGPRIRALDANNGQPLWSDLFSATTISPPTYDAGAVYFQQTSSPYLFSLDAATGSTNWATPFDAQSFRYMAPVVGGGRVFADIGYVHGLGSFDQVTGTNQWFVPRDGFSYEESAPAYYNGKVYTWLGDFTEWNPTNGAVNWRLTNGLSGDAARRTVAIADGRAYFVGDKLYCVNLATKTNEWAVSGDFGWTPAVANGIVYAISNEFVSAFTTNGVFVRQFGPSTSHGEHYGPLIVTDDVLIVVNTWGIHIYRLADGSLQQYISSFYMECFCYPSKIVALANNTLYVSSGDYAVYAYATRPTTDVTLINPAKVGDGNLRFGFTNTPGATFTAWASTNLALPHWTPLGYVTQFSSGQYQFTDLQATNHRQRYYHISSP